ncbi:MFS transporter [Streptomyces pinistramenti]|uniref:MFS transporter n=1 Tax=Streptomyces pinistramenti TaxID=2884812 RepID=UPI001D0813D3|nr:MFS transporter [Streptomyces pinistramenti]MCB5907152.1 MFS transporter [Streptomyces pinistramenti]
MTHDPPPPPAAPRRRLAAVLPDLAPWRTSRDFRLMWWAGAITVFGSFLTFVAVPLQVKELTGSAFAVGALGAVELVPLIVFGLYGGALADAMDRRRLIVWTEAALGLLSVLLLLNSVLPHPLLWPLYVAAAATSALTGLQRPALNAIVPRIVPHDQLAAAAALNSLRWQIGAIAGPALAGGLLAYAGLRWAYTIDAATYAASVLLSVRIAPSPAARDAGKPSLRGIAEGARYAWSRKELLGTYAIDLSAMLFAFPLAIFPFLADELDAPWSLGLMYAALPAGSCLVSLTSGWTSRVRRQGRAVVLAAAAWGLAMAAAGQAAHVWLVLLFLTLAGACDMVSGIFRSAMWNQTIPDELRGRLAGIELLSYAVGPQLGQVRVGGMAALTGVRTSVWAGGAMCFAAVALLALALPKLLAYDAATDEHARRLRERATAPDTAPDAPADPGPREPGTGPAPA